MEKKERIRFIVSGEFFEMHMAFLYRYPTTLLGRLDKKSQHYRAEQDWYTFNRDRQCFGAILFFHQTGILSCPSNVPIKSFVTECKYFKIPREFIKHMLVKDGIFVDLHEEEEHLEECPGSIGFVDDWKNSIYATYYGAISIFVIIFSVISACLESMAIPAINFEDQTWEAINRAVNYWFTIDLCARFIAATKKIVFLKKPSVWVDTSIVLLFIFADGSKGRTPPISLYIYRLIPAIRLFQIPRYNNTLKVLIGVYRLVAESVHLFVLATFIFTVVAGEIFHFLETPSSVKKGNFPESLWWAIMTITTVGVGDITPKTIAGKLFASFATVFGILTMWLPIFSLAQRFVVVYVKNFNVSPLRKKKKRMEQTRPRKLKRDEKYF